MTTNHRDDNSTVGYGEYDAETVERVHQENIRKSRLAAEPSRFWGNANAFTISQIDSLHGPPLSLSYWGKARLIDFN